jgi:transcriptional regulator with XRE-family HTH domain
MEFSKLELARYLKSIRENLGYSIYEVNKLCQISPSYLSLMENGKRRPSPIILKKLSSIYNIDYNDLLTKAGFSELIEKKEKSQNNDFRYANHNGINTEGLDENDIEEINRFVEFIKNKKKNEKK